MSMLTLFESRYTLKGRYNIGNVGKTASMSMLTLFESRYTFKSHLYRMFQHITFCCSQKNCENAFKYFVWNLGKKITLLKYELKNYSTSKLFLGKIYTIISFTPSKFHI